MQFQVPLETTSDRKVLSGGSSQAVWLQKEKGRLNALLNQIDDDYQIVTGAGILNVLPPEEITDLKQKFEQPPGRIGNKEFTEFMIDALSKVRRISDALRTSLTADLHELFLAIDLDGSGTVSWEEFTHYLLNSYQAYSKQVNLVQPYRNYKIQTLGREPSKGSSLHYLESLQRCMTVDNYKGGLGRGGDRSVVKIFGLEDVQSELYAISEHDGYIVSSVYIPEMSKLVLGKGDSKLEFHVLKQDRNLQGYVPGAPDPNQRSHSRKHKQKLIRSEAQLRIKHLSTVRCNSSSLVLHWDPEIGRDGRLFSGSRDGSILLHDISQHQDSYLPSVVTQYCGHTEPISCISTIPGVSNVRRLVSASFFGRLAITDLEKNSTHELSGSSGANCHHQGVYSIDYDKESSLLVTAGFEPDAFLWLPIHGASQYIGRLTDNEDPHKHSLLGARIIPGSYQVITCDSVGMIKIWDTRKGKRIQSWYLQRELTPLQALSFQVTNFVVNQDAVHRTIYCTAKTDTCEAKLYTLLPQRTPKVNPEVTHDKRVSFVLHNPTTSTFITAAGVEIKIWNTSTGLPILIIPDCTDSIITGLSLDDRGRRFITGTTDGSLRIHSYATGAVIQKLKGHQKEISCTLYLAQLRMVCSTSADGSAHIYKDSEEISNPTFILRTGAAVLSVVYSPRFHLLILSDSRQVIHIYDFHTSLCCKYLAKVTTARYPQIPTVRTLGAINPIDFHNQTVVDENVRTLQLLGEYMEPDACEVVTLIVLEPYPVIVASLANGTIQVWTIRPHQWPNTLLSEWRNQRRRYLSTIGVDMQQLGNNTNSRSSTINKIKTVVTTLIWSSTEETVTAADDHGWITVWNYTNFLEFYSLMPAAFPAWGAQQCTPINQPLRKKPTLRCSWYVTNSGYSRGDPVTHFSCFPTERFAVVAGTLVTIWSNNGDYLGVLCPDNASTRKSSKGTNKKLLFSENKSIPSTEGGIFDPKISIEICGESEPAEVSPCKKLPILDDASNSEQQLPRKGTVGSNKWDLLKTRIGFDPASQSKTISQLRTVVTAAFSELSFENENLFMITPPGSPKCTPQPPTSPCRSWSGCATHVIKESSCNNSKVSPINSDHPAFKRSNKKKKRQEWLEQSVTRKVTSNLSEAMNILWRCWHSCFDGSKTTLKKGIVFHRLPLRPYTDPGGLAYGSIQRCGIHSPNSDLFQDPPESANLVIQLAITNFREFIISVEVTPRTEIFGGGSVSPDVSSPEATRRKSRFIFESRRLTGDWNKHKNMTLDVFEREEIKKGILYNWKGCSSEDREAYERTLKTSNEETNDTCGVGASRPSSSSNSKKQQQKSVLPTESLFESLLQDSAFRYPLVESPYLQTSPAPALSPYLFSAVHTKPRKKVIEISISVKVKVLVTATAAFSAAVSVVVLSGPERRQVAELAGFHRFVEILVRDSVPKLLLECGKRTLGYVFEIRYDEVSRRILVNFELGKAHSMLPPDWPINLTEVDIQTRSELSNLMESCVSCNVIHDQLSQLLTTFEFYRSETHCVDKRCRWEISPCLSDSMTKVSATTINCSRLNSVFVPPPVSHSFLESEVGFGCSQRIQNPFNCCPLVINDLEFQNSRRSEQMMKTSDICLLGENIPAIVTPNSCKGERVKGVLPITKGQADSRSRLRGPSRSMSVARGKVSDVPQNKNKKNISDIVSRFSSKRVKGSSVSANRVRRGVCFRNSDAQKEVDLDFGVFCPLKPSPAAVERPPMPSERAAHYATPSEIVDYPVQTEMSSTQSTVTAAHPKELALSVLSIQTTVVKSKQTRVIRTKQPLPADVPLTVLMAETLGQISDNPVPGSTGQPIAI